MKRILTIALPLVLLVIVALNFLPASSKETAVIKIDGMTCGSCEAKVTKALQGVAGVQKVEVSHSDGKAEVTYDAEYVSPEKMEIAVVKAGFSVGGEKASKSCCPSSGGCGDKKEGKSI